MISRLAGLLLLTSLLAGCAGSSKRPQPAELPPDLQAVRVQPVWSQRLGPVGFVLEPKVIGQTVVVADSAGTVALLDIQSGKDIWRTALGVGLSAGVGFDGRWGAVVSRDNELMVLEAGKLSWRQRLPAQSFTAPLVAGERVFVLGADRSVSAFDARSGRRLWVQQRAGEPLVLRQSGVLLAVGNTLVTGLSGKLAGLDPGTGSVLWDVAVANPRGTNDLERLVDLVAPVSRQGSVVCVRAFQAAVACADALRGNLLWTKNANGAVGLGGDGRMVFGSEADGTLLAWRSMDGERIWSQEALRFRAPGAPFWMKGKLFVQDGQGLLHVLQPADGVLLTRINTGSGAPAAAPVLAADLMVTVSRTGSVQAWQLAE